MKKFSARTLLAFALLVPGLLLAQVQDAQAPAGQTQQQSQPGAPPAEERKEIKDPAEYNSYLNAINLQDANAKASALEGFLQQYPNSVVKQDALELLMATYQQAGNPTKTVETANRLLQVDPSNVRALALLAFSRREAAEAGQNPQQNLTEGRRLAERGLQALQTFTQPPGVSQADFANVRKQISAIFHGVIALAAMQNKEYATAQQHFTQAVQANPNNLRDVYPLALSYLQAEPPQDSLGLWFIARAVNLASGSPAQQQIAEFGRKRYATYHGSEEGWQELIAQTRNQPFPPQGFQIAADSPAKRAARMAAAQRTREMSLAEWEFILTNGDPELAKKVWGEIQQLPSIAFRGQVIEASRTRLRLAGTAESIEEGRADVEVTMAGPIPANLMPKVGSQIDIQGKPASYDQQPFLLKLEEGMLITRRAPAQRSSRPR